MSIKGLAAIVDKYPSWELTPFWLRMIGKPRWRAFIYGTGKFAYIHVKPEITTIRGIDRSPSPFWRSKAQ